MSENHSDFDELAFANADIGHGINKFSARGVGLVCCVLGVVRRILMTKVSRRNAPGVDHI